MCASATVSPVLIETGCRLSSDHLPRLIQTSTGVDWAGVILDGLLGRDAPPSPGPQPPRWAGVRFLAPAFRLAAALRTALRPQEALGLVRTGPTVRSTHGGPSGYLEAAASSPGRLDSLLRVMQTAGGCIAP